MKKKYEFQQNPDKLPQQAMDRHKNFDSLLQQFKAAPALSALSPLYKLFIGAGALAAAVAGVLAYQALKPGNDHKAQEDAHFASLQFVNPPISHLGNDFEIFEFEAGAGGVFLYPNGTRLTVPPAAFIHEDGKPASGKVSLKYREIHDIVDIFLSGIPMEYDSAGMEYHLESGGMLEVGAEQAGKRLDLAPGKQIEVEMVSLVNADKPGELPSGYNIYYLDQEARQWVFQAVNKMEMLAGKQAAPARPEGNDADLPQTQPADGKEPGRMRDTAGKRDAVARRIGNKAKPGDHVFDLDLQTMFTGMSLEQQLRDPTYNELMNLYKAYDNMLWRISPRERSVTPEQLKGEFAKVESLSIKRLEKGLYELTLGLGGNSQTVLVEPVNIGSMDGQSLDRYAEAVGKLQQGKGKTKKSGGGKPAFGTSGPSPVEEELARLREQFVALQESEGLSFVRGFAIPTATLNRFPITSMGVWNVDKPFLFETEQEVLAEAFIDEAGLPFGRTTVYLADAGKNSLVRILAQEGAKVKFNRNSRCAMWLVTEDNEVAVFRPAQFNNIARGTPSQRFVMERLPRQISSEAELRKLLFS